jgi:hypothetical protein
MDIAALKIATFDAGVGAGVGAGVRAGAGTGIKRAGITGDLESGKNFALHALKQGIWFPFRTQTE